MGLLAEQIKSATLDMEIWSSWDALGSFASRNWYYLWKNIKFIVYNRNVESNN